MNPASLPQPRKILVIRLSAIGDVLLVTPVIRALRKAFPMAQVDLLTYARNEPVLLENPYLSRLLLHPGKNLPGLQKLKFARRLRLENYDWVFDMAATPRTAWLTLATGARLRVGYAFRVRKWAFNHPVPKGKTFRKYQVEVNLDLLRDVGIPDDGIQTDLFLNAPEKEWAQKIFEPEEWRALKWKIGLNATGGWSSKRWPVSHWRGLIALLHGKLGIRPILLRGAGNEDLLQEIRSGLEEKTLLEPETDLRQSAAFISQLDLLVGNDGTPQHMAQALGVRSLTLCGPTWGLGWVKPDDPRHRYLQHFLDCGPCDFTVCPFPKEEGKDRHVYQECLVKIAPEKVITVIQDMLGNRI